MKKFLNVLYLPWFTLASSLVALLLSYFFYSRAVGTGNLLRVSHPAGIALLILCGAVAAVLVLATRKIPRELSLETLLPSSPMRGVGCFIGTVGIAYSCILSTDFSEILSIPTLILGIIAGICMIFVACQRLFRMPAHYLFYGFLSIFFMCLGLLRCRQWGTETQVMRFFFGLLAYVFLLLTAFQYTSVCLAGKTARNLILFSHLSVFFCCAAFPAHNDPFYLTCALWLALDACFFHTEKNITEPTEEE